MYVGNLDFQTDAVRHFSHEYTCTPPRSVSRRGGTVAARLRLALAGLCIVWCQQRHVARNQNRA